MLAYGPGRKVAFDEVRLGFSDTLPLLSYKTHVINEASFGDEGLELLGTYTLKTIEKRINGTYKEMLNTLAFN